MVASYKSPCWMTSWWWWLRWGQGEWVKTNDVLVFFSMYNGKHCPRGYSCVFLIGPAGNSACRAEKSIEWGQEQEKQEIMKKDHLILLAFLQRLMLGKKSLPKMKVMLRHNKHLYILFWWHEKKNPPQKPTTKKANLKLSIQTIYLCKPNRKQR